MASEVFQLYLLLTLKDYASSGLNHLEAQLRGAGKEGAATLRTFQSLREDMSKGLQLAGIGIGGLMLMRKGIETAASFEESMTELRLSIERIGPDGAKNVELLNDQMSRAEALAVSLGNRLPMTTESAVQMLTKLRQGGLDFEKVLGGAGETVAKLAILTHEDPAGMGLDFARFAQEFKLSADETKGAANVFLKGYRTVGLTPSELMETFKYFQTRVGASLGLTGVAGAQTAVNLMTLLARHNITGRMAGTETAEFFGKLAAPSRQMTKALDGIKKQYGVTLDFYKDGKFLGIDNAIAQMGKLSVLTQQQRLATFKIIGGERAMGLGDAFMGGQKEWQAVIEDAKQIPDVEAQMTEKIEDFNVKLMNVETTLKNIAARGFMPMLKQIEPMLEMSNQVASFVADLIKAHPALAEILTDVGGIGSVLLVLYGAIRTGTTAWGLYTLASTAATRALQGEAVAAGEAAVATDAAALKVGRLSKMLGSLGAMGTIGLVVDVAIVGVGSEYLKWLHDKAEEWGKQRQAADSSASDSYEAAIQNRQLYRPRLRDAELRRQVVEDEKKVASLKPGKEKRVAEIDLAGHRAQLDRENAARQTQESMAKQAWGQFTVTAPRPFMDYPAGQFRTAAWADRGNVVNELRVLGKGVLGDPNVLAKLINQAQRGDLRGIESPKELEVFSGLLKEAFGDSTFKQAQEIAAQDVRDLGDRSKETATNLQNLSKWFGPSFRLNTVSNAPGVPGLPNSSVHSLFNFGGLKAEGGRVLKGVQYVGGEKVQNCLRRMCWLDLVERQTEFDRALGGRCQRRLVAPGARGFGPAGPVDGAAAERNAQDRSRVARQSGGDQFVGRERQARHTVNRVDASDSSDIRCLCGTAPAVRSLRPAGKHLRWPELCETSLPERAVRDGQAGRL